MRHSFNRDGFTLIELLVVISILALLAAMLMPAITGAQASARAQSDANNVGQLIKTAAAYRADHGGTWATPKVVSIDATTKVPSTGDDGTTGAIFYTMAYYMKMNPNVFNSPASSDQAVSKVADEDPTDQSACTADEINGWAGGTGEDATHYAIDWSAPRSAGSARPVLATRKGIAAEMAVEFTNVAFGDGHTEKVPADDDTYEVVTYEPTGDDIYTDAGTDNDKFGAGDKFKAHVR